MKYIGYIFSILSFIMFVSCSKEATYIEVSEQSVIISNDNTPSQIIVKSNADWVISQSNPSSGFRISPMQGKSGETNVKITAAPNMSSQKVVSNLIITSGGVSKTVELSQISVQFSTSVDKIDIIQEAEDKTFTLKSNTKWSINVSNLPEWIESITPNSGNGDKDEVITIKTKRNDIRREQEFILSISYGNYYASVVLKKGSAFNNPPTKPEITSQLGKTTIPNVTWTASTDADGDKVSYFVEYSTDKNQWNSLPVTDKTSISFIENGKVLKDNTKYYIRVVADDDFNKGKVPSDIVEITTGDKDCYEDGGWRLHSDWETVKNPVKLVFTGDGYLPKHFIYGGLFDQKVTEAVNALFSVEPYKTYKKYFSVYKVAAYSNAEGVSDKRSGTPIEVDTYFKATLTGGTGIECDYTKVFNQALKIPGFEQEDLYKTSICLIMNADMYAGTCYTVKDGSSIGMVPVCSDFGKVVCHEYGGHGFGRLADEYVNYEGETIPESEINKLHQWQDWGYSKNVSTETDDKTVPWARFIGRKGYDNVKRYSGGYYYSLGVCKSEFRSCMFDNRYYYNAQSRYLIVERIMEIVGEEFTFEKFLEKDVHEAEKARTQLANAENFVPLAPPIMVTER